MPTTSTASQSTSPTDTRYATTTVHGQFAPAYQMQPGEHGGVTGQTYQTVQDYGHNTHYTTTMLPPVGAMTHYAPA